MTIAVDHFEYLREVVKKDSAILIEPGKEYLVEARLSPIMKSLGLNSIDEVVEHMQGRRDTALRSMVVEAMTTNETSFFRDSHPFAALVEHIIPSLMEARAATRSLNIWCAASSTGQEPYSIAMLLLEEFPELMNWEVRIVATDLAEHVLARAREGCYSQLEVNRGLPAPLLVKFFTKQGIRWQLNDDIRSRVEFRKLNLIGDWPAMSLMDVVFIRNVLIYFDVDTKKKILAQVKDQLKPDGYLFMGAAETTLGLNQDFTRGTFDKATCYRPA